MVETKQVESFDLDALDLLARDHKNVEKCYEKYKSTAGNYYAKKANIIREMIKLICIHLDIEEKVFYPWVRRELSNGWILHDRSIHEHNVVKRLLYELESSLDKLELWQDSSDQPLNSTEEYFPNWFDMKLSEVMKQFLFHSREEEHEIFKQVREYVARDKIDTLKSALITSKSFAIEHPHRLCLINSCFTAISISQQPILFNKLALLPSKPPFNYISAPFIRAFDFVRDTITSTGAFR